jgi:polyketide cyclase/dehydrase/lipid transport protein
MQPVEASVVVPLSPEEIWDFLLGDPQRLAESFADIVAVEDFQMRPDGTPRYRMVRKAGSFTMSFISDYSVFERPYRTVSRALDTPFGGTFYTTHERTTEGTRMRWRWEVEPQNLLAAVLLPGMRPLLAWSMQRDLDSFAKAAASQGTTPRRRAGSARWRLQGRSSY